jgi:hypothetical protein
MIESFFISLIKYVLGAVGRKFITDNLPNLHIKNIREFLSITFSVCRCGLCAVIIFFLLKMNEFGWYKMSKNSIINMSMCLFFLLILKDFKKKGIVARACQCDLLYPADYSNPNNYF